MKTFTVILEIDDFSGSDGEDIEEIVERLLRTELLEVPSDLEIRIVECNED